MISSKNFIVLAVTWMNYIHLKLIFVYGMNQGFFFLWLSSCPCIICWKKPILYLLNCLGALTENQLVMNEGACFWTFNSTLLIYMSILMLLPHYLDYCSFVVSFEIGKCEFPNFVLLFQGCCIILPELP